MAELIFDRAHQVKNMMNLSLHQLQTILIISEVRSVTRTAEILDRSQPSVSRTLREVEEEVGAQIFDRTRRALELTAHGKVLVRHARSMIAELEHAQSEIMSLNNENKKRVSIGVHPIAATSLIGNAATRFSSISPDSFLEITEGQTNTLIEQLQFGDFDFLITTVPPEPIEGILFEILLSTPLGIFVRKNHPLKKSRTLSGANLTEYPWIYPRKNVPRMSAMHNFFKLRNLDMPPKILTTMSLSVTRETLLQSDSVVMTQRHLFSSDLQRGIIDEINVSDDLPTLAIAIAKREASELSEAVQKFADCLVHEASLLKTLPEDTDVAL